jgi:hypothetical protein
VAQAQAQQRAEALIQAMDWTCRALSQLRHYREARDKQRKKQHAKGHVTRAQR